MNRAERHELERVTDAFRQAEPDAIVIDDLEGPALYVLAPVWLTSVRCRGCGWVSLIPRLPARPLTWGCPACHRRHALRPPLAVFMAARPTGGGARAAALS